MKFIFTLSIALICFCNTAAAQFKLVVNEFSQGPSGSSKEYIELVVAGIRTCKDSTADIRNWIFDDNNGWYGGSGTGIATGHYRFANNANWAAVPYGSIILLYNNADKNPKITIADDPSDVNHDYVYVLPANSTLIEVNVTSPISPSSIGYIYPATGYTASATSNWTATIGLANSGDGIIVVNPVDLGSPHFSITYGGVPPAGFLAPTVNLPLTVNGANNAYLTDNQYNVAASWAEGNVPANETPGTGNTAQNIAWINSMRIQIPPPNLVINNPAAVCSPNTVDLTAATITTGSTPASLVFTYYTDALATTIYPTASAATNGTYYIVATMPGGCADTLQVNVTVNPLPPPPIVNTPVAYCLNETASQLAATGTGLLWYATVTGGAGSATAPTPLTSTAGNTTYYVSQTVGGCESLRDSIIVTVTTIVNPVTGFSYTPATVCENGSNPTLNTVAGFTIGGTYTASPSGLSINANTGAINTAASTPGNYTITYTVAANGCNPLATNTTAFSITAIIIPVTGFSYTPATVCENGSNPTINTVAGFTTGGTYTASPSGLSINANTGAINTAASTPGNYTITYTVAANGCNPLATNTTAFSITAIISPVTGFSYTPATVCENGSNPTINTVSGFTTGGTYTASPSGLSINANTGAINTAASTPGNYTITYTIAANGCNPLATNTSTFSITAIANPVTGFSYLPTAVCANGVNPALNTITGFTIGGTFTASPAGLIINNSTGAINVAASSTGNYTITYSLPANGCNPAASNTASFSINPVGAAVTGFSYLPATLCSNQPNPVLNTIAGFTGGGTYSSLPAGLSINNSTGAINVAASNTGNYIITYSLLATPCTPAASNTTTFTINPAIVPVTGFTYLPASVCANGSNPALNNDPGFASGGTYSASPAGLSINAITGAINVAASSAGIYTIQYSVASNGCTIAGIHTSTFTITANTNAVTTFSYLPNIVCSNGSNPVINTQAGFTAGGTYSATPAGLNINANTGAINLAASNAGTYTILYTVNASGCRAGGSSNSSFTINPVGGQPNTSFTYTTPVCINGTDPVPVKTAGFTAGGIFSAAAGLSVNSITGIINLAASTVGNYSVTYTVPAAGCTLTGAGSTPINITSIPASPVIPATTVCNTGAAILTATGTGIIKWYADAALSLPLFTGNAYTVTINSNTQFYVTASIGNCISTPSVAAITLSPAPAAPNLGNDTSICPGDNVLLNAGNYSRYSWQDGSTNQFFTATKTGIYTVRAYNNAGCFSDTSITITVLPDCDDIYFPSAFSPNGDGYNDRFGALGNLFTVKNYALIIYNRYGEVVFSSSNPYQKWDGIFKGAKYGNNTFVWYASYKYRGKISRIQKGNVTLIR